jgi:hypothetical protein
VHNGERLFLTRTARHAMDPSTPDIMNSNFWLTRHGGNICVAIHLRVKASFSAPTYDTTTIISENDIVACKCSCKCRAKSKTDRHLCVHGLASFYKFSLLLITALAEHTIVALRARIHVESLQLDEEERRKLLQYMTRLLAAPGKQFPDNGLTVNATIKLLLDKYTVGTKRMKDDAPPPPNPDELKPIRAYGGFKSPGTQAEALLKEGKYNVEANNEREEEIEENQEPPDLQMDFKELGTYSYAVFTAVKLLSKQSGSITGNLFQTDGTQS